MQVNITLVLLHGGQPVTYTSRSLSDTEIRYTKIEKEMLVISFGLEKFHHYTYVRILTQ